MTCESPKLENTSWKPNFSGFLQNQGKITYSNIHKKIIFRKNQPNFGCRKFILKSEKLSDFKDPYLFGFAKYRRFIWFL